MVRAMTDIDKTENTETKGERIAKVLARAGVASRREVERMILEGRISLHGKKLDTPATLVSSLTGIKVDGEPITEVSQTKLWRMHKKRGTLTTHRDPEGRPTVFDKMPDHMGRVISVGRLDMNTEGLLLLTNDGELARWLELPANSILRKYRVRVHGRVDEKALEKLKDGATIDGIHYGAIEAQLERQTGANAWLSVAIREGKNREVRRVMDHLELSVNRLIRTHYGPFSLGTLEVGNIAPVGEKQLHEVLADYFKDAPVGVGTPDTKRDPSKWAKAKKPTKVKLGASRKRKFEVFTKGDSDAPATRKPNDSNRRRHDADEKSETAARQDTRPNRSASKKSYGEKSSSAKPATGRKPTERNFTDKPSGSRGNAGKNTPRKPSAGQRNNTKQGAAHKRRDK